MVAAKIANSRTVLLRAGRDHGREEMESAGRRLACRAQDARACTDLDVLRGIEGDAADTYFQYLSACTTHGDAALQFAGRSRRPPRDPFNCLLSFLYSLLAHDCRSALESTGLDAAVGFLHRDRSGRPGMALDLMEEFRAMLADRLALSLLNRKQLHARDFETQETGAVLLRDTARKAVQDFLAAHGATSVKADADAKAKALDDEANGIFQRAQEEAERAAKDAAHAVPLGLAAWDGYLTSVTDSAHKAQAEAAKKELTGKAEKLCQDEDARISDLVKQFDFATAAANLRKLRERLAGTKWADSRKARMDDLVQLRDLHKRVVTAIGEKAREGPLPLRLPFKMKIGKFDVDEWGIAGPCDNEQTLKLDAMAKGKAPGCQKKFGEFTPDEQYKIYRAFLPDPRTAEDQKALAVFCKERGLAEPAVEKTGP